VWVRGGPGLDVRVGLGFCCRQFLNKLLLWLTFDFFFFLCTWVGGDAPATLLFTLLIRGQLRTPVPLFQHTRQKGFSPHRHDFCDVCQEQVEFMNAVRKASLGGKTYMGWW
jgi:hypothetical protein